MATIPLILFPTPKTWWRWGRGGGGVVMLYLAVSLGPKALRGMQDSLGHHGWASAWWIYGMTRTPEERSGGIGHFSPPTHSCLAQHPSSRAFGTSGSRFTLYAEPIGSHLERPAAQASVELDTRPLIPQRRL